MLNADFADFGPLQEGGIGEKDAQLHTQLGNKYWWWVRTQVQFPPDELLTVAYERF